jgi:hypothetical protein
VRGLSTREHALLLAALVVVVGVGFLLFRSRPRHQQLARLEFATEQARERYRTTRWPASAGDPASLRRALTELQRRIGEQETDLRAQETRFASQAGAGAVAELRLEVSRLAARSGVRVLEDVICPRPKLSGVLGGEIRSAESRSARLVRFLALGEPYEMPARRLVLDASFAGLRAFLDGLAALRHRVVVLHFEIERNEEAAPGDPPLRARLLLLS